MDFVLEVGAGRIIIYIFEQYFKIHTNLDRGLHFTRQYLYVRKYEKQKVKLSLGALIQK